MSEGKDNGHVWPGSPALAGVELWREKVAPGGAGPQESSPLLPALASARLGEARSVPQRTVRGNDVGDEGSVEVVQSDFSLTKLIRYVC